MKYTPPGQVFPESLCHTAAGRMTTADTCQIVWAWDVIADQTTAGHKLSWLTILYEPTRECLALEVYRSVSATVTLDVLQRSVEQLGAPDCLRSDGSRHLTARLVRQWLKKKSIQLLVTEPGLPWENPQIEAFHRRMRDEFLDVELFGSLEEARRLTECWRYHYNHRRIHSTLDYLTPSEFARRRRKMRDNT